MLFNLLLEKLTQHLPLYLLEKSLLISALQLSLGLCVTTLETGYAVLTGYPRRPSLCQPSKWAIISYFRYLDIIF